MTGTPDRRTRRSQDTHRRIYETAMRLFREQGFDRVSVGRIALAAGVSVPTFYAHFASKEHVVLRLPTGADLAALLAGQPGHLPVGERIRRAAPQYFDTMTAEERAELLDRWRVVAATPGLRRRAAEFERTTADLFLDVLPGETGSAMTPRDSVVVNAYLSAFTMGVLAWANSDGERKIEETLEEAFAALEGGNPDSGRR